ncbi:YIP1 family protein [Psychrosphaera sp. B3R10]|uniref:Yip1 family protein n=1 Tax=Psychrosphaera algicola TaxID=3023714 RepID=A0ABT5FJW4_9GAMM|nr:MULTISPECIES: Yip1 family protein [unclassified Psychrosphaera]MBU2880868.1 YIP1 family protein [Psychrosphaera sp. I2R16]MBU2990913.1 YIP1 family protein [Psychrosphaera sp. B3R10]MDC2891492.1 Yip1 family protein [Psychrosphaera sp. G1-22]MDO6720609.1 Yip1 family protein [Psychrosphaera sp. 1_MG-2023]
MILNHLWGLYAHPVEEWHTIDNRHESFKYSMSHIMIIAMIPAICAYYSVTTMGWSVGVGEPLRMSPESALMLCVGMYFSLIAGVFLLGYLAHWMAHTFGSKPTYTQTLELAAYTATPLFMAGFAALFPVVWFVMLVGLGALAYSIYLLYAGVPILMHIPEERGFIYASSVVTCGLILLVCIMTAFAMFWSSGYAPAFSH